MRFFSKSLIDSIEGGDCFFQRGDDVLLDTLRELIGLDGGEAFGDCCMSSCIWSTASGKATDEPSSCSSESAFLDLVDDLQILRGLGGPDSISWSCVRCALGVLVDIHSAVVNGGLHFEHFAEAGNQLRERALKFFFAKLAKNAFESALACSSCLMASSWLSVAPLRIGLRLSFFWRPPFAAGLFSSRSVARSAGSCGVLGCCSFGCFCFVIGLAFGAGLFPCAGCEVGWRLGLLGFAVGGKIGLHWVATAESLGASFGRFARIGGLAGFGVRRAAGCIIGLLFARRSLGRPNLCLRFLSPGFFSSENFWSSLLSDSRSDVLPHRFDRSPAFLSPSVLSR